MKVLAETLPPEAEELRRRLRRERADAVAAAERVEATRAELWQKLQREYDLDLDAFHYRIDTEGRLVMVTSAEQGGEESAAGMAAMLAEHAEQEF